MEKETELSVLKQQVNTLQELMPRYSCKTLDNVMSQLESRIKFMTAK